MAGDDPAILPFDPSISAAVSAKQNSLDYSPTDREREMGLNHLETGSF